ncbi:MAG: hypothetical protein CVU41_03105 [Chloroflexi bacterium HGW-Chloroflexi-3]|nr:MAG: hypothetical protein CVU41_03105 [Chloroflexi bacterium HGW-Chloroflexi-3]
MKIKINNSIENKTIHLVISLLEKSPLEIENCTLGIDPRQLQTRQDPDSWSAGEILANLHACATLWGKSGWIKNKKTQSSARHEEWHFTNTII